MFKLVVLCSVLAAALAKPSLAPFAYGTYFAPTTYAAASPVLATGYSGYSTSYFGAPYLPAAPLAYSAPAHFIKKRSAVLPTLPTTYFAPGYSTPYSYSYPSTYHASTYSYPSYVSSPYAYSSHFIKKRSAPLAVSTYLAPAAVSHQSRFDLHSSAPLVTSYASPYLYSSPLAYSHYYK